MRCALGLFFFVSLIAFSSLEAQAQGVLLPDDKKETTNSTSSMGLSPIPSGANVEATVAGPGGTPTTESSTGTTATTRSESETSITPGGTLAKTAPTAQERLLTKSLAAGKAPKIEGTSELDLQIRAYHAAKAKKREKDPYFLTEPEEEDEIDNPKLKSNIVVGVSKNYLWGPEEVEAVGKHLGYAPREVPQNCQLRFDVELSTDSESKRSFSSKVYTGKQKQVKYDSSKLKSISLEPEAVCLPPTTPLPRRRGIITKVGRNYAVTLTTKAECLVPENTNPRYLDVQYMGDGKVNCQFR